MPEINIDLCHDLPLAGNENTEHIIEMCKISKRTGVPIEKLVNSKKAVSEFSLKNDCDIFPKNLACNVQTDDFAEPTSPSFDPTMWGVLFFVWALLYIPRLITALIKGADKYEPSAFEGWWIVGVGFLFWGYNEQIAVGDTAGCLFVLSLVFWPLWLNKNKALTKIINISRKSRVWVSAIIVWTLVTFTWFFGKEIWSTYINEGISSFFLMLLLPPLAIAALWKLYGWVSSAQKP